jgi:hypothetical protein
MKKHKMLFIKVIPLLGSYEVETIQLQEWDCL